MKSFALWIAVLVPGCLVEPTIRGTTVLDTPVNNQIIGVIEQYRHALEARDPAKLLAMASPQYLEDGGTVKGDDDYGYDGLKQVLETRLGTVRSLRFMIEYRAVHVVGNQATVEIRYDASYQMATAMGDRWEHKADDKRIKLELDGSRWLFVGGM